MRPLVQEAKKRREERARHDPTYAHRIHRELNEGRVNVMLFIWGDTHEPPAAEKAIIGTHTIVSYDHVRGELALISLTHDIRTPEVERRTHPGRKGPATKIDQAYLIGGFDLNRTALENATGLSMDFQIAFREEIIQRLVDQVLGAIEVDIPRSFEVIPFYLDGTKYERGRFEKGRQALDGKRVIQFIKTLPADTGKYYGKDLENNARKSLVIDALMATIRRRAEDKDFWLRLSGFVARESLSGAIAYDFAPVPLIVNNIGAILPHLKELGSKEGAIPTLGRSLYVVDPCCGDGGVRWADGDPNAITKRDLAAGVYPDAGKGTQIPFNANPYGDLVQEYWPSVRRLVARWLLEN
jgi:hypothetical protein